MGIHKEIFNDLPAKAGRLVLGINAAVKAKAITLPDQSGLRSCFLQVVPLNPIF